MAAMINLRRVLTQSKPEMSCSINSFKNSTNVQWPDIKSGTITRWNDFNLETLNQSYGHILDFEFPAPPNPGPDRVE